MQFPDIRVFDGELLGSRDRDGILEGIDVGDIEGSSDGSNDGSSEGKRLG